MRVRKEHGISSEDALLIAQCSDALAHPARVEIFKYIYNQNMAFSSCCNKDLIEEFGYAQSTISQHISKLVASDLIEVRKSGVKANYYVNVGILQKYLNSVKKLNER